LHLNLFEQPAWLQAVIKNDYSEAVAPMIGNPELEGFIRLAACRLSPYKLSQSIGAGGDRRFSGQH
jgi:hypothetical protein